MPSREEMIAFLENKKAEAPAKSREEMIQFLEAKKAAPKEESELFNFGPTLVKAAGYVADIPNAVARGLIGKGVGTEKVGLTPSSSPSYQEITEKVAPSTAKMVPLVGQGPGGIPMESMLTPDEMLQIKSQSQVKPSVLIGAGLDLATTAGLGYGAGKVLSGAKAITRGAKNFITSQAGPALEYTPIENADEVKTAFNNLGIDAPKGVLTSNQTFQKLESGLSQSGSFPAKSVRNQYQELRNGIDAAKEKIAALKTTDSDFALGSGIQKDIAESVNKSRAPVSELYEQITPQLRKIPVNKDVTTRTFAALKRNPLFQTKDGIAAIEEAKQVAMSQGDLASLKEWRSTLRDGLGPSSTPLEEKRVQALAEAVTSIRDKSISAMKADLPKSVHGDVDELVNQIALADAAHASNIKDINSIKSIVGNKDFGSPGKFLGKLSDAKEADLAQRAANLDVQSMRNLQEKFPSVYEKAKTARVNDIIQRSTDAGSGFNSNRFLKQYESLDKETRDLLFSPEIQSHINDYAKVHRSLPAKLGPSGTPEGQMMMDMFNPKRNLMDFGIKKTLDAATAPKLSLPASAPSEVAQNVIMLNRARSAGQSLVRPSSDTITLPKAADQKPSKGPDKWANDGLDKIQEHSDKNGKSENLDAVKGAMRTDNKLRELVIMASDLKPGTKAMDSVMQKIRARLAEGEK